MALLVLAFLPDEQGVVWYSSPKRKTLYAILHGPQDWVQNAAVLALVQIATYLPQATKEIQWTLRESLKAIPERAPWKAVPAKPYCAFAFGLTSIMRLLPDMVQDERQKLTKLTEDLVLEQLRENDQYRVGFLASVALESDHI